MLRRPAQRVAPSERARRRRRGVLGAAPTAAAILLAVAPPSPARAARGLREGFPPNFTRHAAGARSRVRRRRRAPVRPVASVSIDQADAIGPIVPQDFLGLSFEASTAAQLAAYANGGDLVNLMRALGPGLMRIGGITVDTETAWSDEAAAPPWAHSTVTPQDLAGIAALARASGWRVLLTVTLGHFEPAAAAQEARVAQEQLGPSLFAIALGNEPDRYVADGLRVSPWTFADYLTETAAYRAAIAAAAPGVAIVGPDSSSGSSTLAWITEVAAAVRPPMLTEHYYPLTKCQAYAPKLADLLSPATREQESAALAQFAGVARASGIPLRLDETNNVSCRGQPGVSNVFASALWAVDYLARAMASGVAGLNFHDLITEPESYSPLVADDPEQLASGALQADPEWYALLLARSLLGDTPVQADPAGADQTLTAAAFQGPAGELHVVLVNFAPAAARQLLVRLRPAARFRSGPILRLTAPGLRATTGVTLGGGAVSPDGTWTPLAGLPQVSGVPGALELEMPAGSAALLTLYPTG